MHLLILLTQPFQVLAVDQGKRPKTSSDPASIIVTVKRNDHAPEFPKGTDLIRKIRRDANVDTVIIRVQAPDNDDTVSSSIPYQSAKFPHPIVFMVFFLKEPFRKVRYSIIGDDTAPVFFSVNAESGDITLSDSVNRDELTVYKVVSNVHFSSKEQPL